MQQRVNNTYLNQGVSILVKRLTMKRIFRKMKKFEIISSYLSNRSLEGRNASKNSKGSKKQGMRDTELEEMAKILPNFTCPSTHLYRRCIPSSKPWLRKASSRCSLSPRQLLTFLFHRLPRGTSSSILFTHAHTRRACIRVHVYTWTGIRFICFLGPAPRLWK